MFNESKTAGLTATPSSFFKIWSNFNKLYPYGNSWLLTLEGI